MEQPKKNKSPIENRALKFKVRFYIHVMDPKPTLK